MNELYDPFEPERARATARAKALLARYNRTGDDERSYRGSLLRELLTHPIRGLENYDEMIRTLTDSHDAIKVYVEVAENGR